MRPRATAPCYLWYGVVTSDLSPHSTDSTHITTSSFLLALLFVPPQRPFSHGAEGQPQPSPVVPPPPLARPTYSVEQYPQNEVCERSAFQLLETKLGGWYTSGYWYTGLHPSISRGELTRMRDCTEHSSYSTGCTVSGVWLYLCGRNRAMKIRTQRLQQPNGLEPRSLCVVCLSDI